MKLKEILNTIKVLPEASYRKIEALTDRRRVKKWERIIHQDCRCNTIIFLAKGIFRFCFVRNGKERTIAFAADGDVFTSVHSYFCGQPSVYSYEAIVDSEIYMMNISDLKELVAEDQAISDWLMTLLLEQLRVLEKKSVLFGTLNATERYKTFVLNRSDVFKYVPSKYIAQYLDIAPETLSRLQSIILKGDKEKKVPGTKKADKIAKAADEHRRSNTIDQF